MEKPKKQWIVRSLLDDLERVNRLYGNARAQSLKCNDSEIELWLGKMEEFNEKADALRNKLLKEVA